MNNTDSIDKERQPTVAGIVPFTMIDYPNHISAVIFLQGCCWHCPYCHNAHIIDINKSVAGSVPWTEALAFLNKRKGKLDGVVFSGGEPLLQPSLYSMICQVRDMGYSVALHTNGHNPDALAKVLPVVDWIGLDIKAPFSVYHKAICRDKSDWDKMRALDFGAKVLACLDMILAAKVPFECRTTLYPKVLSKEDLRQIGQVLSDKGVKTYAIQEYRRTDDSAWQPSNSEIYSFFEDKELMSELDSLFPDFIIRR